MKSWLKGLWVLPVAVTIGTAAIAADFSPTPLLSAAIDSPADLFFIDSPVDLSVPSLFDSAPPLLANGFGEPLSAATAIPITELPTAPSSAALLQPIERNIQQDYRYIALPANAGGTTPTARFLYSSDRLNSVSRVIQIDPTAGTPCHQNPPIFLPRPADFATPDSMICQVNSEI